MTASRTLKELMDLSERVVLVTGGGGHIGGEAAAAVAELGAAVALVDVDEAGCEKAAESLTKQFGIETAIFPVDLAEQETLQALPGRIVDQFGRLDAIVNAAAFVGTLVLEGWTVPFEKQSIDTWRSALEVNLTSVFVLVQAAAKSLQVSGRGSIINIASIYGMVGPDMRLYEGTALGNPAAYGVSKGGLLQLTRWLATVLAPDIRVNAVTPGGIQRMQPDVFIDKYLEKVPLGRMAVEEDIKGAVAYLASDLSAYVTGQNIVVDGGWTVW